MPSLYVQADRPLTIKTPLGPDVFLVAAFEGREALSELYRFNVDLVSEQRNVVLFEQLLGQEVTVTLRRESGSLRYFSGIVRSVCQAENLSVTQGNDVIECTKYRLELVPKLWLLSRRHRSRIFQQMTVPDILKDVLTVVNPDYQLESFSGNFESRDYCVQYRETDLAFALRLMEEEGIYFFFKHSESGHQMVVANTPTKHTEISGKFQFEPLASEAGEEDRVFGWRKTQQIRSGKYTLWDYSFELPGKHLEADKSAVESVQAGTVTHKLNEAGKDQYEIYDWPGGYASRFDGIAPGGGDRAADVQHIFTDNTRTVALRMQAETTPALSVEGSGSAGAFSAGYKFTLDEHFSDNGQFVLTSVEHHTRQSLGSGLGALPFEYTNSFTCIPAALSFRPQRVTPVPVVYGTHTAVVDGPAGEEIFTDKYGRVKVQFPWDRETSSSCWVRVATPWAGKQWGAIHIPRIGQEVVVAFEEGNPNQPIIVGSVYNASLMPPYELPANKTQSGIKSRSSMSGSDANFNEFRFEDKKGDEQVVLHAEKDLLTEVENDETRTVGNDRTTTIQNNETKTVKQGYEKITLDQGDQSLTISMGKQTVVIQQDQNVTLRQGNQALEIQMGNQSTKITLGKSETEAMQSIELKVGQSSVKLDPMGVTIQGMMIKIEGQIQVEVKGMMTQINGDAMLIEKGGIVMIN